MRNIALSAVVCQVAGDPVVAREASTGTRPLLSRAPFRSSLGLSLSPDFTTAFCGARRAHHCAGLMIPLTPEWNRLPLLLLLNHHC